jgi:hypothetical protein
MPRFRDRVQLELDGDLALGLLIGPVRGDGLTDEVLEAGWWLHRATLMAYPRITATRPWGYWRFELCELPPGAAVDAETLRLAELGDLTADELAALREKGNEAKLRIDTGRERVSGGSLKYGSRAVSLDQRDVELFEAVRAAIGGHERDR